MLDKGVIDSVIETGGKIPSKNPFLKKVARPSQKHNSGPTFVPDLPAIREHLRKQRSKNVKESDATPRNQSLRAEVEQLKKRDDNIATKTKKALAKAKDARAHNF